MLPATDLVWYACYGSNLDQNRFLCYLQGGTYPGNDKEYQGARDPTPFKRTLDYQLQHDLYFAKEAHIWGGGGVCFIENADGDASTYARLYLITAEQFCDLHAQECNQEPGALLDLSTAVDQGYIDAYAEKWYGRILYLGQQEERPIFTFTNVRDLTKENSPHPNYLKSLMRGLHYSHRLEPPDQARYFLTKRGIAGHWSEEELTELCRTALT